MVTDNNNNDIKWYDGFYWTMVTMSTLGYGDITFTSLLGKFYSLGVMLFGMFSMFVILPFAFIRFAYEPWMEAQNAARTPRTLPKDTHGHVILTNLDPVCCDCMTRGSWLPWATRTIRRPSEMSVSSNR